MIYNIPKSKATDLLERCNQLSGEDRKNQLILQRLKNEAEHLMSRFRHHSESYQALGCIYTFMNKEELTRKTFQEALHRFPHDFGVHMNYAICLNQLGFPDEALPYAEKAYEMKPGEWFALNALVDVSVFSAQFQQAERWYRLLEKIQPHLSHQQTSVMTGISHVLAQFDVSDRATNQVMQTAFMLLRRHHINIGTDMSYVDVIREDDETEWITRLVHLKQAQEKIVDLNIELAEELAEHESLENVLKGKFLVRYISE